MSEGAYPDLVGNDVVDLMDPETDPDRLHRRFDARVFAARERALLAASAASNRLRWRLWAAKEAAYKVARKLDAGAVWAPSRFVVDPLRRVVRHRGLTVRVFLEETAEYIHAVAAFSGPISPRSKRRAGAAGRIGAAGIGEVRAPRGDRNCDPAGCAGPTRAPHLGRNVGGNESPYPGRNVGVDESPYPDPSAAARDLALAAVATALACPREELAIVKRGRIPLVLRRGAPVPIDLSLSHHGRFVAWAFVPVSA